MNRISRLLKSFAALALIAVMAFSSVPAFAVGQSTSMAERGDKYIVNVNGLNFRKGPGLGYGVITSLKKGTTLTYISNTEGWWKVYTSNGKVGYVDRQYLTQDTTEKSGNYFVTATELRIRKAPKTSAGVLGKVKKGTMVTITKLNGDWGYLAAGAGVKGWVALEYLSHVNSSTSISDTKVSSKTTIYEVTANVLNVRASGSTRARRIDAIREGEDVIITKTDDDWVQVVYKKGGKLRNGWVKLDYLAKK